MLAEVLNTSGVKRLQSLLHSRYGAGLKVKFLVDSDAIKNSAQSPSEQKGDLQILIEVQSRFFALAEIPNSSHLKVADKDAIAHLVKMILEPSFYNWELQNASLESPQALYDEAISSLESYSSDFIEESFFLEKTQSEGYVSLGGAILIESFNPHLIQKIAFGVHEVLERWAFLNYNDIKAEIHSANDLRQMGRMSLLVNDILELSPTELDIMTDFIASHDENEHPLILVGATNSLQDLAQKWQIHEGLLKVFKMSHLKADLLPLDRSLLRQTLELWLTAPAFNV